MRMLILLLLYCSNEFFGIYGEDICRGSSDCVQGKLHYCSKYS